MYLRTDEDSGAVIISFEGSPGILEIQDLLMKGIEMVVTRNKNKAVIDTSKLEVMFTLSLYWYRKEWYPLANRSGLKSVAIILPGDFAQSKFLERLNDRDNDGSPIKFKFYTELNSGLAWLKKA